MPDIGAIASALSSLKAATDIAKTMIGLRDAQAMQAKVIELNGQILDAQGSVFAANQERATLIEKVRQLEKQLVDLEAWDAQKDRYQLTDAGDSNFVLILKPEMRGGEPAHYICANCYEQRKKAILQHMNTRGMGDLLSCPLCKTKTLIAHGYIPPGRNTTAQAQQHSSVTVKSDFDPYKV